MPQSPAEGRLSSRVMVGHGGSKVKRQICPSPACTRYCPGGKNNTLCCDYWEKVFSALRRQASGGDNCCGDKSCCKGFWLRVLHAITNKTAGGIMTMAWALLIITCNVKGVFKENEMVVNSVEPGSIVTFRLSSALCPIADEIREKITGSLEVTGKVAFLSDGGKSKGHFAIIDVSGIASPVVVPVEMLVGSVASESSDGVTGMTG